MKKCKKRERNNKVRSNDRISKLPDEILIHILSFVHTMEVVQTCILSKRWRHIWASVPVLNLNFDDYKRSVNEELSQNEERFDQFVEGWLENRQPVSLDLFLFHSSTEYTYDLDWEWLESVPPLFPKVISIIFCGDPFDLPDSMFSSASLQHLDLDIFQDCWCTTETIDNLSSIDLPSLKTLSLCQFSITDIFIENLFTGCPVLERLELSMCDLSISEISSSVLKDLTMDGVYRPNNDPVQISCPSLVSLASESSSISLKDMEMASLISANIVTDVCDLKLGAFSHATCLKIIMNDPGTKERLEKDIPQCKTFNNLRRLELGHWYMGNDFDLVACLIKNSPLLEKLTLHLDEPKNNEDIKEDEPKTKVPRDVLSLRDYLDMVEIISPNNDVALADELVKTIRAYVKTIGNVSIM